ncbi:MAG TPA: NUDIX domain-containing protein [Symbiobacteriaceae bacterium]|nr:NUDIX domain-containing protein [Symbiobacteriaceae bacterium]
MDIGSAAVCYIVVDGRILLMQAPWAGNRWGLIGGKIEPGETPDQAVKREVLEETGLTLTAYRSVGHVILDEGNNRGTSLHLFVATAVVGELRASDEGEPVWVGLAQAEQLPMIEYARLLLPRVLGSQSPVTGTIRVGLHGAVLGGTLI